MAKALDPAAISSFGKLLRLLASEHDGERATAARKATEFLKSRSLDWHDIVSMLEGTFKGEIPPEPQPWRQPEPWAAPPKQKQGEIDHRKAAADCLMVFNFWTEREQDFLFDMRYLDWPTEKQLKWLRSLYERYLREIGN